MRSRTDRRAVGRAIRRRRLELTKLFAETTELFPRWANSARLEAASRAEYLAREFEILPIYLEKLFLTDPDAYRALFTGERIKAFYDPAMDANSRKEIIHNIVTKERAGLESLLRQELSASQLQHLLAELDRSYVGLTPTSARKSPVLFVGDCLFLDIGAFLMATLCEAGIDAEFSYASGRNARELRESLKKLGDYQPSIVFFSPFSYELLPEYAASIHWKQSLSSTSKVEKAADSLFATIDPMIAELATSYECPIYIHNCSGLVREESPLKRRIKNAISKGTRSAIAKTCSKRLAATVDRINQESFRHVFAIDELSIVEAVGHNTAGAYFYKGLLQHPARLGELLAHEYLRTIFVHSRLMGKKLVVCDLDNTLWNGLIGEGEVAHYDGRQRTLKALKQRGVLLSILSKNDPTKVHWRGATLSAEDFVHSEISWAPKVTGMDRTQKSLNLKTKDFVFLDDRADERALILESFGDVVALPAETQETWDMLSLWAERLDRDPDMDRTEMYKQRARRIEFTGSEEGEAAVDPEMFKGLQLKGSVLRATAAEAKRTAELINRTNQFNLEGTRTSIKEVSNWIASKKHIVLLCRSGDRFGDMGITCVAVAELLSGEKALIRAFVLSCRVFGYGFETIVLNRLRSTLAAAGCLTLVARYQRTPFNQPCSTFLPDNGFAASGDAWELDLSQALPADPVWVSVGSAVP